MTIIAVNQFYLYLAITKPYMYQSRRIRRVSIVVVITIWIALPCLAILFRFHASSVNYNILRLLSFGYFSLLYIGTCCMHVKIHKELKNMQRREASGRQSEFSALRSSKRLATAVISGYTICYAPPTIYIKRDNFFKAI